jgi:hydroxypyruvate reductase
MNIVRKHISSIAGGRLLEVAVPATIRALVVSDVVGDDLSSIGSGPCSPDASTYSDALFIIQEKGLEDRLPRSVIEHLRKGSNSLIPEPPKPGSAHEENADVHLIGSNKTALEAMAEAAADSGYRVAETLTGVTGEAREIGSEVGRAAAELEPGSCLIWGGETTVTVTGPGSGGRNHEVALAAALELDSSETSAVVLSAGTDGIDGSTDAAGAWADSKTVERAQAMGIDARIALAKNNSGHFFATIGQSLVTGPTHTNVTDIGIALR